MSTLQYILSLFAHEQSFMDHKNHLQWQNTLSA